MHYSLTVYGICGHHFLCPLRAALNAARGLAESRVTGYALGYGSWFQTDSNNSLSHLFKLNFFILFVFLMTANQIFRVYPH